MRILDALIITCNEPQNKRSDRSHKRDLYAYYS